MFIYPALFVLYGFRFDKKTSKKIQRPCLILINHQTVIDHLAISMGFKFGMNYVATDSIFRHGFLSKLMVALVRPIPFSKGSSDLSAIKNMMSVIRDGGAVAMFPSGNRSFFGDESTIVQGIGKLAKKFNVPLVLVQQRGGYNTIPRWKAKPSRGKITAVVTKVVSPEEMAAMSVAEVDEIIQKELSFNEFEYNKTAQIVYRGRHKAEYLESVLFYCPQCGSMTGLFSEGNDFMCRDCGAKVRINGTGFFEKVDKAKNLPETILEWGRLQLEYIKNFDFSGFTGKPVFSDNDVEFSSVAYAKKEALLGTGTVALYADKLSVCGQEFPIAEITTAIIGARKMTVYHGDNVYSILAPFRTNFMKYMISNYLLRNKALNIKEEYYGY